MYSITSRDRRVTEYVKKQAYKWLFGKIVAEEYVPHGAEANTMILTIKDKGGFDEKSYEEFTGYFVNNPYNYILNQKNPKRIKGITTDKLANYFIKYNEVVLPVGFIKDFFEDDYETQRDITEYYNGYTGSTLNDFILGCQMNANKKDLDIRKTQSSNPFIFNTKLGFHICNIIKLILTVIGMVISISYFSENKIITNLINIFKGKPSTYDFEANVPILVANVVFLLFLIPRVIKLIKLIFFYISYMRIRLYANSLRSALKDFNTNVVKEFEEFFKDVNVNFPASGYTITEDMYSTLPGGTKKYINVLNFSYKLIEDRIRKITTNKRYSDLGFVYKNDNELAIQRPLWRKGIVFFAILIIAICCFNIEPLRMWIVKTFKSIVG